MNLTVPTASSKKGLVETYKAIASRFNTLRHTKVMGEIIKYSIEGKDKDLLLAPLERGYISPGKFITVATNQDVIKTINDIAPKGQKATIIVHRLLRYLEINNLDANDPPKNNEKIDLKHKWF